MRLARFAAQSEFEDNYVRPAPGRTMIVGSRIYETRTDRRKAFPNCIGVDMLAGDGVDMVLDLEEPLPALGLFDHIECLSVLEHSKRPWLLAANLERLMRPGATIFLTVPFIWRVHGYPNDYFRFTVEGVRLLLPAIKWATLLFGNDTIDADLNARGARDKGSVPLMLRTEVFGFGVRR